MSRSSAVTSAGRARAIPRSATPAVPRRVSGPAGPPDRGGGPGGRPPPPHPNAGQPARAPHARIDATALAQAAVAVAPQRRALPAPARRRRAVAVPARPRRLAYGGVAIATRMADVALDVSSSRAMDRLVRSRIWIGVIAFALLGIVATQVSLLKLNTGISKAVLTASTLERSNAGLRREVSRLSAPDRIRPMAEAQGLVMPAPADVGYLRASDVSATAKRAATSIQAPDTAIAGPAGSVITTGLEDVAAQEATGAPQAPGTSAAAPEDPAPATSAPSPQEAPAAAAPVAPAPAAPAPAPSAAQISGASGGATAQQSTPPVG
ncbi:MAG: hypothetical protein WKF48_06815 [Solirubrobacteraceae bacterium]